jgi:hypothetical protein
MVKPHDNRDWYDIAQICLNGHVITGETVARPESIQPFCRLCGLRTITACKNAALKYVAITSRPVPSTTPGGRWTGQPIARAAVAPTHGRLPP